MSRTYSSILHSGPPTSVLHSSVLHSSVLHFSTPVSSVPSPFFPSALPSSVPSPFFPSAFPSNNHGTDGYLFIATISDQKVPRVFSNRELAKEYLCKFLSRKIKKIFDEIDEPFYTSHIAAHMQDQYEYNRPLDFYFQEYKSEILAKEIYDQTRKELIESMRKRESYFDIIINRDSPYYGFPKREFKNNYQKLRLIYQDLNNDPNFSCGIHKRVLNDENIHKTKKTLLREIKELQEEKDRIDEEMGYEPNTPAKNSSNASTVILNEIDYMSPEEPKVKLTAKGRKARDLQSVLQ